jgi:TolA-binding protein
MKKLLLAISLICAPALAQNAKLVDETIADLERRLEEQDARSRKDREALEKMIRGMAFDISELKKQLEAVKKSIPAAKPAPAVLPMAETDLLVPAGDAQETETEKSADEAFEAKDYKRAAIAYAELIKGKSGDFYRNLLFLGRSMAKLEKKTEACESFATIAAADDAGEETKAEARKDASEMKCDGQP